MSFLFLKLIELYWLLIPASKRKSCLFRESCSRHVHRITKEVGFTSGFRSFIFRFKHCRPGYEIIKISDEIIILQFSNGIVLQQGDLSEKIIDIYNNM